MAEQPERQIPLDAIVNLFLEGRELPAAIRVLLPILNLPPSLPVSMVRTMGEGLLSLTLDPEPVSGPLAEEVLMGPAQPHPALYPN
jgi:hypothetical protein